MARLIRRVAARKSPSSLAVYATPLFYDNFDLLNLWLGPSSVTKGWRPAFDWGTQGFSPNRVTEYGSGRGIADVNRWRQWHTDDDILLRDVTTSSGTRHCLGLRVQKRNITSYTGVTYPYSAGLITSEKVPNGIFTPPVFIECSFRIASGLGMWSAMYLYNILKSSDTSEIDFFEGAGADGPNWPDGTSDAAAPRQTFVGPTTFNTTGTSFSQIIVPGKRYYNEMGETNPTTGTVASLTIPDLGADFNLFQAEWRTDRVVSWVNGQKIWESRNFGSDDLANQISAGVTIPNPAGGMYLILHPTCLGSTASVTGLSGDANNNTNIAGTPAFMDIDYVAAWAP